MKAVTTEIKQDQPYDWGFSVALDGQPQDSLRLVDFQWQENLSSLYQGTLTLVSHNPDINLNDCIDRNLVLTLHHKYDDQIRYLAGVVESMVATGFAGDWVQYSLNIRPDLHRLSLVSDARIFQQTSVPDIVATILKEQGIPQYEFRLKDNHLPREYCVIYQEDYLTFINRLLAEEGIFYFWEHSEAGAKLVFTDQSAFGTALVDPEIEYNNSPSGAVKGQFLNTLVWREAVRSTDLKQRDYCFKNPRYNQEHDLFRQREGGEAQSYPLYNAYGRYKDGDSGKRFTQYQLEGIRNDASLGTGNGNALHFSAGHRFFVNEHPALALNREYLIVGVEHSGVQPQAMEAYAGEGGTFYHNNFTCHALSAYSWRPQPSVKPKMDGPQIAHVVGPEGEEIYCDEHGRVKVQFPWDLKGENNEHSSCWIRVSQGWAGAGWGGMAIPRIGQEVIVDFLEGDPDQPIITGRTYHTVNTPPYGLPANKTRMSIKSQTHKGKGFNELRFEDENGREEVFIHAQKDQNNVVGNDETTQVGGNRGEIIGHNEILQVGENRQEQIGGAQQTVVNKDINIISQSGNINLQTAGASITLTADGQIYINGKQVTVIGTQDIQLNPDGAGGRPALQPLNLDMKMPKIPGQLQASKTSWPVDVPEPGDPTKPEVNSPPRQKSTYEKMEDWSRAAGQTNEAILEDIVSPSIDNLKEAKSSYNKGDLAGASAAVGMAAAGMLDPTRKGKAVKKAIIKKEAKADQNRIKFKKKGIPDSELGPSGKPKLKIKKHPTMKRAKDAAQARSNKGKKPEQHGNPTKGEDPHFHPDGKKHREHHTYPAKKFPRKKEY